MLSEKRGKNFVHIVNTALSIHESPLFFCKIMSILLSFIKYFFHVLVGSLPTEIHLIIFSNKFPKQRPLA